MKMPRFAALLAVVLAGSAQATTAIDYRSVSGVWPQAGPSHITSEPAFVTRSNWVLGKSLTSPRPASSLIGSGVLLTPPGVAAIPEPDAWALLVVGLGAIGVLARRRSVALTA